MSRWLIPFGILCKGVCMSILEYSTFLILPKVGRGGTKLCRGRFRLESKILTQVHEERTWIGFAFQHIPHQTPYTAINTQKDLEANNTCTLFATLCKICCQVQRLHHLICLLGSTLRQGSYARVYWNHFVFNLKNIFFPFE
jgi:hypothetical protein